MSGLSLHPTIDGGVKKGVDGFAGGTLKCQCETDTVEVRIASDIAHNHACGCTKCWKPKGAAFSIVGVVRRDTVTVLANGDKLAVVDETATIRRHACTVCGAHLYGRIENQAHGFYGLDFIHTELSPESGWQEPRFAAFVSSIIEGGGARPEQMDGVRKTLTDLGLTPYDALNPPLMDVLSTAVAKQKGILQSS